MSFVSWHNYGIGVCTDDIETEDVERLRALLAKAPKLEEKVRQWIASSGIKDPTWEDYMEYDQDYYLGLTTILKEVILEAEGIEMTACDNFDGKQFLIYPPKYPWKQNQLEMQLTENALAALFNRYISILTVDPIEVKTREVENGG